MSVPNRRIEPAGARPSSPDSAAISSCWPLPDTPATPRISPPRSSKQTCLNVVPNGSPYHRGKPNLRLNLMVARVVETGLPLVYLNMVGGQDDQVFDGSSMVLNPGGHLAVQMPQFDTCITHVDFHRTDDGWRMTHTGYERVFETTWKPSDPTSYKVEQGRISRGPA